MKNQDETMQFDFSPRTEKFHSNDPDLAEFLQFLENRNWTLSTQIPLFDPRKLRNLAEASQGKIISGNKGYKLTKHATVEEIDNCSKRLRSQANSMVNRAMQIDRVYHNKNF